MPLLHFLDPRIERARVQHPELAELLPRAPRLPAEEGELHGHLVVSNATLESLASALTDYLETEERVQVAILRRRSFDSEGYAQTWRSYRTQLARILEHTTSSDHGRGYIEVFWLHHSLVLAQASTQAAARIRAHDPGLPAELSHQVRYSVLFKVVDRMLALANEIRTTFQCDTRLDVADRSTSLLERMRDNVLILSQLRIGPDLAELSGFFRGYLKAGFSSFQSRFAALRSWHLETLRKDSRLRAAVAQLMEAPAEMSPDVLLFQKGYVAYLATLGSWSSDELFSAEQLRLWHAVSEKLREFELMDTTRRDIWETQDVQGSAATASPAAPDSRVSKVALSASARPLDFATPWIVDPEVQRGGLIYDMTDFTAILSVLRLSQKQRQESSFRRIVQFQALVDQVARNLGLTFEKYLGDGALYSSRELEPLVIAAVTVQQSYTEAVRNGFPFDRGMRLALNYGQYRLFPFAGRGALGESYEVFGHGLVELSRLVSGKKGQNVEEMRSALLAQGYAAEDLDRFFEPLMRSDETGDPDEDRGRYHAFLTQEGALVNEGMVVTGTFLEELGAQILPRPARPVRIGAHRYVYMELVACTDGVEERHPIAVRRLGRAQLKGLEPLAVYELLDARGVEHDGGDDDLEIRSIVRTCDANYTMAVAR